MKARSFNARGQDRCRQPYAWALPAFLLIIAGCSGKPDLEFAEVEGTVTLNNQRLSGVMVRFYPISEGKQQLPYATGISDATGNFTLSHHGDKPGALVGPSRVVVSWPSRDLRSAARDGPAPPSAHIPLHYTVAGETPLAVEVKPGGPQTIDLNLSD